MSPALNGTLKDTKATISPELEADISQLSSLLSQDIESIDGPFNLAELLERLSSADGMAKEVESKLDGLLGNLDNLLAALEGGEQGAVEGEAPLKESSASTTAPSG